MIFNISPFSQLRIILASVKCKEFELGNMYVGVSEVDARARTLGTATMDQVKTVTLSSVYIVISYSKICIVWVIRGRVSRTETF